MAEGAISRDLEPIKADDVKNVLTEKLGLDTRVTTLGHTQRGGKPCAYDRVLVSLRWIPSSPGGREGSPCFGPVADE